VKAYGRVIVIGTDSGAEAAYLPAGVLAGDSDIPVSRVSACR
jgi:hypothetical protein